LQFLFWFLTDFLKFILSEIEYLQGTNLLDMLDNGVLLCQLAKLIQDRAEQAVAAGFTTPVSAHIFIIFIFMFSSIYFL